MFTNKYFVKTIISMNCVFFSASIVYYGLAYKAADLPGSVYTNNTLNALVDVLAYVLTAAIMEKVGRKIIIGTSFGFAAVTCITCGVLFYFGMDLADGALLNQTGRYLSFVGKFCISAVHGLVYVYVSEVFPTSVRSIGTAISLLGDEIGAIVAPYIIHIDLIWIPFIVFGACAFLAAILSTTTLIETRNKHMPNTLVEMEQRAQVRHDDDEDAFGL